MTTSILVQVLIFASIFLLPLLVTGVAYFLLFSRSGPPVRELEHIGLERYNQVIRSIVTVSLLSGFLLLTWVGKIEPPIFANTFSMILAFWFAKQLDKNDSSPPKS